MRVATLFTLPLLGPSYKHIKTNSEIIVSSETVVNFISVFFSCNNFYVIHNIVHVTLYFGLFMFTRICITQNVFVNFTQIYKIKTTEGNGSKLMTQMFAEELLKVH